MNNEQGFFKLTGLVRLEHRKADGSLIEDTGWMHNTVCNSGKQLLAMLLASVSGRKSFGWLAVGSSTTAVAATDRTLATEITASGLGRSAATITQTKTTVAHDSINFYKQWTASGSVTVNEIGIFNTATANTAVMLCRKLTGAKTLASGETLTANYKIVIS